MDPVTALSLGRIGLGVASLAKPGLVSSAMGTTSSTPLLTQWFGSREIAIGTATLLASGTARRNLVLLGAGVDAADAATALAAVRARSIPRPAGLAMTGIATGAVLAGLAGLAGLRVAAPVLPSRR